MCRARDGITFRWVKGHSGDRWNDIADRLAVEAAQTQRARQGDGLPATLGGISSIVVLSAVLTLICATLLLIGQYKWLYKIVKVVVVILT